MIGYQSKTIRLISQVFFWTVIWLLTNLVIYESDLVVDNYGLKRSMVTTVCQTMIIASTIFFLFPKLFSEKKYLIFLLISIVIIILLVMLSQWGIENLIGENPYRRGHGGPKKRPPLEMKKWLRYSYIARSIPFVLAWIVSTIVETTIYANQRENESILLRSEKLETEMKFLKSQINPHFLFNALNNIYTLTVIKSEKAPDNLLKLSNMLRYVLYDCNEDEVPLKKDIAYLKDYIALKKLKDSGGLNIEVDINGQNSELNISPMLFIPFVENAFKHSKIEDIEQSWIKIKLWEKEGQIFFEVKNTIPQSNYTKDKIGGIGLENVLRRLELLYPDKHSIEINQQDGVFSVQLKIDLT